MCPQEKERCYSKLGFMFRTSPVSFPQVFVVETHCGLTLLFECGLLPGVDTAIIQPVN